MNRQGKVCLDVHLINMRKIDRCWLQVTTPYFFSCRPVWENCRYPATYSAFVPISLSCFPLCSLFHNCFFLAYQATAFHATSLITAIQRRARSDMPCCFPAVRFGLAGSASPIPFRRKDLPTWFHLLLMWKAGSVWQASRKDNAEPSQICTSCPCVISRRDLRKSQAPNHSVGLPI